MGWRSRGRSYREKDLQKFAWSSLEYVTNKVSQKNMAQLYKGRQKMTQGLVVKFNNSQNSNRTEQRFKLEVEWSRNIKNLKHSVKISNSL